MALQRVGKRLLQNTVYLAGFYKSESNSVAFKKVTTDTVAVNQNFRIVFDAGGPVDFDVDQPVTMPVSVDIGDDLYIYANADGDLVATKDSVGSPGVDFIRIGGFHYAPNDNAALNVNGNWANHTGAPGTAVPQINAYSFWDLKWRPSAADPRGLTLVPGLREWWGMYPMNNGGVAGKPIHSYGVNPCRDGNPPLKRWADGTAYADATPMNIFELLASEGFRPPNAWNFQYAALGTTEQAAAGGSDPGNTGEQGTAQNKNRFVSAWGLFDITGVINAWGADSLPDNTQTAGVTQGRSNDRFRVSFFTLIGGDWNSAAAAGSRIVNTVSSSNSFTNIGGRGVCSHQVIP